MNDEHRVQALMTADDQLHDVKRARLWARLEARLPAEGARPSARAPRRWAWLTAGALAAAAATAALWLGRGGESPRALVAPADATLTAMVGPYARVAVVGPARVEVGAQGETSAVRVRAGTMLAAFEGGAGRSLRVAAPGVEIEVVGTLFAVAVDGSVTCVSVAHGRVRVTRAADVVMVGGDERLCNGEPRPVAIEPSVREALLRHEQLIATADPRDRSAPRAQPIDPPRPAIQPAAPLDPPPAVQPALRAHPIAPSVPPIAPPHPSVQPAPPIEPPHPSVPPAPRARPIEPPASVRPAPRPTITPDIPPATRAAPRSSPPALARPGMAPGAATGVEAAPAQPAPPPQQPLPTPAPSPAPSPAVTAETLYHDAETALARGDVATADRALARIVDEMASSSLYDQALYERARLAYQRHAWSQARRDLDLLATVRGSALAEPGQYLACRVALAAHDADVARCFATYRGSYPRSPHALDVLALLVELAYADGGCHAAERWIGELVHDHPDATPAHAWRARCPERR